MTTISGWGRFPVIQTEILAPRTFEAARIATASTNGGVARGNGRAYGDAGIGARQTLQMRALDRVRAFDASTGLVTVEGGVLLADLIEPAEAAAAIRRGIIQPHAADSGSEEIGMVVARNASGKVAIWLANGETPIALHPAEACEAASVR